MSALPQPAVGRVGVYEIGSPLGMGGMGEVYRARDTWLDRLVAIKFLLDAVAHDPDRLARFEPEAKLLASLNHPHIAQIYGVEDSGPKPALIMELVEGPTLRARLPWSRPAVAGLERRWLAADPEPERPGDLLSRRRTHDGRRRHGSRHVENGRL